MLWGTRPRNCALLAHRTASLRAATMSDVAGARPSDPPRAPPLALRPRLRVECAVAPCVVTKPWESECGGQLRALINPANPALAGTSLLQYFPRGGPAPCKATPEELRSSTAGWGGMEAGVGMVYPAQCVDGLVHLVGGGRQTSEAIERALQRRSRHRRRNANTSGQFLPTTVRLPMGDALVVEATHKLGENFDFVAHTPGPFVWSDQSNHRSAASREAWVRGTADCYTAALRELMGVVQWSPRSRPQIVTEIRVATPLLGAGTCGGDVHVAAEALLDAVRRLQDHAGLSPCVERSQRIDVLLRVVVQTADAADVVRASLQMLKG